MEYIYGKNLICSKNLSLFLYFTNGDTYKYILLDDDDVVSEDENKIPIKVTKKKSKFEVYNVKTDEIIPDVYVTTKILDEDQDVFAPGIKFRTPNKDNTVLYEPMPCNLESQISPVSNVGKLICRKWTVADIKPMYDSEGIKFPTTIINTYKNGIVAVDENRQKNILEDVRTPFQKLMHIGDDRKDCFGRVCGECLKNIEYEHDGRTVKLTTNCKKFTPLYVSRSLGNYLALVSEDELDEIQNNLLPELLDREEIISKDAITPKSYRFIVVTTFGVIFEIGDDIIIYNRLYDSFMMEFNEHFISPSYRPNSFTNFCEHGILYPLSNFHLPVAYTKNDGKTVSLRIRDENEGVSYTGKEKFDGSDSKVYDNITDYRVRGKLLPLVEVEYEPLKLIAQQSLVDNPETIKDISFHDLMELYAENMAIVMANNDGLSLIKDNKFRHNTNIGIIIPTIEKPKDPESVVGFKVTGDTKSVTIPTADFIYIDDRKSISGGELSLRQKSVFKRFFESNSIRLKPIDHDNLYDEFQRALKMAENVRDSGNLPLIKALYFFRFNAKSSDLYFRYKLVKHSVVDTLMIASLDPNHHQSVMNALMVASLNSENYMVVFNEDMQPIDFIRIPDDIRKIKSKSEERFLKSVSKVKEVDDKQAKGFILN